MLQLIVYAILITKINQLDLKHLIGSVVICDLYLLHIISLLYLKSSLCDYSDAYILVKGTITITGNHPKDRQNRPLILKNNAPFGSCTTKINGELIEDADDLDIAMSIYNLLE